MNALRKSYKFLIFLFAVSVKYPYHEYRCLNVLKPGIDSYTMRGRKYNNVVEMQIEMKRDRKLALLTIWIKHSSLDIMRCLIPFAWDQIEYTLSMKVLRFLHV